jgi:hypothetical protein
MLEKVYSFAQTDSDEMSEDIDDASGGEDEVKDLKAKGKKKEVDPVSKMRPVVLLSLTSTPFRRS